MTPHYDLRPRGVSDSFTANCPLAATGLSDHDATRYDGSKQHHAPSVMVWFFLATLLDEDLMRRTSPYGENLRRSRTTGCHEGDTPLYRCARRTLDLISLQHRPRIRCGMRNLRLAEPSDRRTCRGRCPRPPSTTRSEPDHPPARRQYPLRIDHPATRARSAEGRRAPAADMITSRVSAVAT